MMIGLRIRHLSPNQPSVYIMIAAKKYGGVVSACDAPMLKPILLERMIDIKNAKE